MQRPGWILVIVGVLIAGIRPVWLVAPTIPCLGRLPGDIVVERPGPLLLLAGDVLSTEPAPQRHSLARAVSIPVRLITEACSPPWQQCYGRSVPF